MVDRVKGTSLREGTGIAIKAGQTLRGSLMSDPSVMQYVFVRGLEGVG